MKKLMNKTIVILLLFFLSCDKKNEIEHKFVADNNNYWEFRNYCYDDSKGTYFQFKEDGTYNMYLQYINEGFSLFNNDGDLKSGPRLWSIKDDSTFVLNKGIYKIEKITNTEILLSYYHYKIKNKKCFVKLSKWVNTPKGPRLLSEIDTIKK